jgi:hypothetical protein
MGGRHTFKLTGSPSIVTFFIAASFRDPFPSPALLVLSVGFGGMSDSVGAGAVSVVVELLGCFCEGVSEVRGGVR